MVIKKSPLQSMNLSREFSRRGVLLTILLIFGVIGLLAKIWSIIVVLANLNMSWMISPSQNPLIDTVSTLILAVALYGIWQWKKWGAYLIFGRLAYTMFVQLFVYHSLGWQLISLYPGTGYGTYTGLFNIGTDIFAVFMWLLAFSRKWTYFK